MKKEDEVLTAKTGVYLSQSIYAIFGIVDYFMLPDSYLSAWLIRYSILISTFVLTLLLRTSKNINNFPKSLSSILLAAGVSGIQLIIIISKPDEPAFYTYWVGLILMILACQFIFRLPLRESIIFFTSTELFYLFTAIFIQKLLNPVLFPSGFRWLIGNFFFMTFAGIISMMGIAKIHKEIKTSENAKAEAERANLLKSIFLTNISHEIRTPLTAIVGYSKLISEEIGTNRKLNKFSDIVSNNGAQLTNIVDSIISIAEIKTGHVEISLDKIDLHKLLLDAYNSFTIPARTKDLQFNLELSADIKGLTIINDQQKLTSIINNLLSNAVKFTQTGKVSIQASLSDKDYCIIIKDTGIGIPVEYFDKISQPFFQIDQGYERSYGGNGLGLSISKSYIELLGGSLEFTSSIGRGSDFTARFPLKKG